MKRAPIAVIALLAVTLTGCGGPTSKARAIARQVSRRGDPVAADDAATNARLDQLRVGRQLGANANAVYALLAKGRHAAIGAQAAPDVATRPVALRSGPQVVFMSSSGAVTFALEFAEYFKAVLDPWTTSGYGGRTETIGPTTSPPVTEDNGTQTVSNTVSETWTITGAGSTVKFTLAGEVDQTVTDDKSHAVLVQLSDARTYSGQINVCPDGAGAAPATVTTHVRVKSLTKTASEDMTLSTTGHVSDQAALTSLDSSYTNISSWDTGGFTLKFNSISEQATGNGFSPVNIDLSAASFNTAGTATDADASAVGGEAALNLSQIEPAFLEAQRLWRNGRCVMVTVPQYDAETPEPTSQQHDVQHKEDVDKGSETNFQVTLKHRFGGTPTAPIDATLAGDKKIDPDHAPGAPTSFTYTAGDHEDDKADLTLVSTSKRGIGTLVIEFRVKPKKLALAMDGTVTFGYGPVTLTAQVHGAKATFEPVGDGTYRASLPASTSYTVTFPGENCNSASGSENSGSIVFNATSAEGPDKKQVWHVTFDPQRSTVHTSESACGRSFSDVALSGAGGGLVGAVASALGPLTFPSDGGTVHVNTPIFSGTFVATVPK